MKKFLDGYRTFRADYYTKHQAMLQELMAKGQSAKAMMISCADSRIDPSLKFGAAPGDFFMVRNVANMVPPYQADGAYHGTSAALEFAVLGLKVENIIVMGHAKCGGIGALIRNADTTPTDFIGSWMKMLEPARDRVLAVAGNASADHIQRLVEQEAVKESLKNLMSFPWIKERVASGTLKLHGWYFDLADGALHIMDGQGAFKPAEV